MARRTSCCRSFICSPQGGNFTCASRCLSLCYCFFFFLYIIVPPKCCHSNWRRKRKDRGVKKQFQSSEKKQPVGITLATSPSASVSGLYFFLSIRLLKIKLESLQTHLYSWVIYRNSHHAELCKWLYLKENTTLNGLGILKKSMYWSWLYIFDIWIFFGSSVNLLSRELMISAVLPCLRLSCFPSTAGEFGFGLIDAEIRACNFKPLDL